MGHWQQQACPVWHSPTTGQSSKEAASSFADGALAPERAPASQSDTFAVQLAAPQPTCKTICDLNGCDLTFWIIYIQH